ncbi:MAG TPA: alkyl hydroperoxide reductase, partial [Alphaproteobacteria bacterium]
MASRILGCIFAGVALVAVLAAQAPALPAQSAAPDQAVAAGAPGGTAGAPADVTFAEHVAPILQEKCQICHQPNSIAPMSLLTYQDARRWAPMIKQRVAARIMPPWHINRTVG